MELNKTKKWIYIGSTISVAVIFVLGSWWLYLVFKLASRLNELNIPELKGNLVYMIQWEGTTFIILLFLITLAHIYMFLNDQKKTRAVSAFFASMGHELKTPLASIRLQGQVIADLTSSMDKQQQLTPYIERLKEDTERLENELEKSLQLSRLEIGGNLNSIGLEVEPFIRKIATEYEVDFTFKSFKGAIVIADEFALKTIFKNLFDNTCKHNKSNTNKVLVNIEDRGSTVQITYKDFGKFEGDTTKLGQLFYKHNSPKGSGVGIYLIKKLTRKMHGHFKVRKEDAGLIFMIELPKGESFE